MYHRYVKLETEIHFQFVVSSLAINLAMKFKVQIS